MKRHKGGRPPLWEPPKGLHRRGLTASLRLPGQAGQRGKNELIDRLEAIARRYHEIEQEMARPEVAMDHEKVTRLAREQRTLLETVETYDAYRRARQEMERHKGGRPPLWETPQ